MCRLVAELQEAKGRARRFPHGNGVYIGQRVTGENAGEGVREQPFDLYGVAARERGDKRVQVGQHITPLF